MREPEFERELEPLETPCIDFYRNILFTWTFLFMYISHTYHNITILSTLSTTLSIFKFFGIKPPFGITKNS